MLIVVHIGESINEYRQLCRWYMPEACPTCEGEWLRRHGHYLHSAGDEAPVPVFRFRCNQRGCHQVFAVLPDLFTPHQSLPIAIEEQAVSQYAATLGTCKEVGASAGVSASTVWRWVQRAAAQVEQWVTDIQRWLQESRGAYRAVEVDETLRPRWWSRRLRLDGTVTKLLLLDRLPQLVRQCRATVVTILQRGSAVPVSPDWPTTALGFCRQVLPGLVASDFSTHKLKRHGSFQPATVGPGGEPHG